MRYCRLLVTMAAACLWMVSLEGAEPPAADLQQILKQLQELQKTVADQQKTIEALQRQVAATASTTNAGPMAVSAAVPGSTPAAASLPTAGDPESAAASAVDTIRLKALEKKVDDLSESSKKTFPSMFNPAIGLVGETIFSCDSKGNNQTGNDRPGGFDAFMRSAELNLSASVDPFARGYAVLNASADSQTGEAAVAVEEAALVTSTLPWGLTATGGRFFAEFGREGYVHDHELPTVNRPLVLDQYIGGETKTDGYQMNWLLPTSHYISLTAGVGDQMGSNIANPGRYREADGLTYWGHLSTYFTLTPDLTLETGLSAMATPEEQDRGGVLVQPNGSTATEKSRRVAGVDVTLNYQPLSNNQFAGLTWRTEVLNSSSKFLFDPDGSRNPDSVGALSGDEFRHRENAFGLYSMLSAKLSRAWNVGFEFDYLQNPANNQDETFAYSPFVTWYPSHFQQFRLQYTHTDRTGLLRSDDALYLQWVWIIGSHSHGFTSR